MIYPSNFEQKTGFDIIREHLRVSCLSNLGKQFVDQIQFTSDPDLIINWLAQAEEFKTILELGLPFPVNDYFDLTPELIRIKTPGTFLEPETLYDLKSSLETIQACLDFFKKPFASGFAHLCQMAGQIYLEPDILKRIGQIMDEKGLIRDDASPKLHDIRKEISKKITISEKRIGQIMDAARNAGWTPPDADVTLRDGRLVIPVLASHKRKLKGLIHDESSTGQTVFIEPEESFELNNEIRELENAEKREIIRILTVFTDFIRPFIEILLQAYQFLGKMDFLKAKGSFAIEINACKPKFYTGQKIAWKQAVHPLLFLAHKAKRKKVVPLDINLDATNRVIVISGPNAGGKSVCLKTVGLLQYMIQSGLLVPMQGDSEMGIFDKIFFEIGDEQSLENDLSTYSSHLLNIKFFLENADSTTLFLIDEFGSGTDPILGGAIAESALEDLNSKRAFGVVTTHYSNLKLLADQQNGIINGAMLFDTKHMQPLFQLVIGKPGSSFAFEIAEKIGFPPESLRKATKKTGKTHLDFDRQLQELELEKLDLIKQKQEFEVGDSFINELIEKYQRLSAELESSRNDILRQAKEQALQLIEDSNRVIERTIREIKESQAARDKTKEARQSLKDYHQKIEKLSGKGKSEGESSPEKEVKQKSVFSPGEWVKMEGQHKSGYIFRMKGNEAIVDFGGIRFTVSVEKLIKAEMPPPAEHQYRKNSYSSIIGDLNQKTSNFKLSIDLRGKRADEALAMVQKYIDDAILLRVNEISILHGKGEGILRKLIREYLSGLEEVKSFSDEHIERGGAGITKIFLK
jgi:DNA mismatch repair protein MutS2